MELVNFNETKVGKSLDKKGQSNRNGVLLGPGLSLSSAVKNSSTCRYNHYPYHLQCTGDSILYIV